MTKLHGGSQSVTEAEPAQAADTLRAIAYGLRASQALLVAAQLNVADHLAHGPLTAPELAHVTKANEAALERVMRALCALGVFAESRSGHFSLNEAGQLLRSDVPGSFRAGVLLLAGGVRLRCWSDLLETVRTGVSASERLLGMPLFDFYAAHPEESEINDDAMRAFSAAHADALLKTVEFPEDGVVVDVGGGTGALLAAILAAHPRLYGILYDRPNVVRRARRVLSEGRVADRCAIVGGSFFDGVPRHGSVYILKQILHDWDDELAGAILRCCQQGIPPAAKLLIIERRLPEPAEPGPAAEAFLSDLGMLVMTGGRERTEAEFAVLLANAGFKHLRTLATSCPLSVFEALPS
jgi:O-methyltransferase/methyltransferase family protein